MRRFRRGCHAWTRAECRRSNAPNRCCRWDGATSAKATPESYAAWPIVVRSPRVAWIKAHRDVLEPAANKFYGPEAIGGWKPGDPDVLELATTNPEEAQAYWARLAEEQMAWHAYADWVSKNIKPPPPDMRYCLPVPPSSQETELEDSRFHAAAPNGLIWKPSAAARRLRAAILRWRCCSS